MVTNGIRSPFVMTTAVARPVAATQIEAAASTPAARPSKRVLAGVLLTAALLPAVPVLAQQAPSYQAAFSSQYPGCWLEAEPKNPVADYPNAAQLGNDARQAVEQFEKSHPGKLSDTDRINGSEFAVQLATHGSVEIYPWHGNRATTTLREIAADHGAYTNEQFSDYISLVQQMNPQLVPQKDVVDKSGHKIAAEDQVFKTSTHLVVPFYNYAFMSHCEGRE